MPPVIAAIAYVLVALGASEVVALALAPFLLSLGSSLILGAISKMFVKGPSGSSLRTEIASRTITSRQSVACRQTDLY